MPISWSGVVGALDGLADGSVTDASALGSTDVEVRDGLTGVEQEQSMKIATTAHRDEINMPRS